MYLQNALIAIQQEIGNSTRYSLLYKFIARAHLIQMQTSYNEAHAKISSEHLSENEAARRATEEKGVDNSQK